MTAPTTDVFRVFAYDINTNTPITELRVNTLSFDSRLNDAGAIQFTLDLLDPSSQVVNAAILAYDGNPFAVYVDRSGVIVWGGIVWTTLYQQTNHKLVCGGKEFLSYFDSRVVAKDYSASTYPTGIDPAQLVYKALTDAQAVSAPGASIGVSVVGGTSTLPKFKPSYFVNQRTLVGQVLADVTGGSSPGSGGVDVSITSSWVAGVPTRTATIWSPRVGRAASTSGLVFDLANTVDYTWPTDATLTGTILYETGAGSGQATPALNAVTTLPVGGLGQLPLLEKVISHTQISQITQLRHIANGDVLMYGQPVKTPTVTIRTGGLQPLGSWLVGDDVRVRTSGDERFPNGYDKYWRIVQQTVTVPDEGLPTVKLTLNPPPVF